jgi:hypothetical protein
MMVVPKDVYPGAYAANEDVSETDSLGLPTTDELSLCVLPNPVEGNCANILMGLSNVTTTTIIILLIHFMNKFMTQKYR